MCVELKWHGLKIEEVAVISGHASWNTLKRYTHIRPEQLHRRFEALKTIPKIDIPMKFRGGVEEDEMA